MSDDLLPLVMAALDRAGSRYALIGAAALAAHGVARSTFDLDLLTTGRAALEASTWSVLTQQGGVTATVRAGDANDPLAGVVRVECGDQRAIDVIVGRSEWQADAVAAAMPITLHGYSVPVVGVADLVLLKLYAGGSQDLWDVEQLLALADRGALIADVERRLARLPADARATWMRVRGGG